MSIVEKAVEKLRLPDSQATSRPKIAPIVSQPASQLSSIERVQNEVTAPSIQETTPRHVDLAKLRAAGYLAHGDAAKQLIDELRRIKRPLLAELVGSGTEGRSFSERIMVTSAMPMEGKTFTALNLALSFAAELDYEVLLVDADIPKADITQLFGLKNYPGLMDALVNGCPPKDIIVRTDVKNLMVLPAGQHSELTSELFGSLRMEFVLRELGEHNRRRLMIFDSSPVLATPDAQALASHIGQTLLVVAAGRTPRNAVTTAIETLGESVSINLVLNMARLSSGAGYYYPYYARKSQER